MGHGKNDPESGSNNATAFSQANNTANSNLKTMRTSLKKEKRKKVRRSVRKKPKDITMYYCNINGFQTKKESVRKIINDLQPKIFTLCELNLSGGDAVKALFPEFEKTLGSSR